MQDEETITDACWALSFLTDAPSEQLQAVLDVGVAPRLVELLSHRSFSIVTPALRAIANIASGDEQQKQLLLDVNVMPLLLQLLGMFVSFL